MNLHFVYECLLDASRPTRYHYFSNSAGVSRLPLFTRGGPFYDPKRHPAIYVWPIWKRPAEPVLVVLYLALYLLFAATRFVPLYWLTVVLIITALFRTLSRNLTRRREENVKFLRLIDPAVRWMRLRRTIRRDKEHRYFKCPNCGQMLRVPRGKGKITVTCRGCGASFQENS